MANSKLLTLPLELRHQIYAYEFQILDGCNPEDYELPVFNFDLLHTSQKLRSEIFHYMKTTNTWIEITIHHEIHTLTEEAFARNLDIQSHTGRIPDADRLVGQYLRSETLDSGWRSELSQVAVMHISLKSISSRRARAGTNPFLTRRIRHGFMPYTRIGLHSFCHEIGRQSNVDVDVLLNHDQMNFINQHFDKFLLPLASIRTAKVVKIDYVAGYHPLLTSHLGMTMKAVIDHPLAFQNMLLAYHEAAKQHAKRSTRRALDYYKIAMDWAAQYSKRAARHRWSHTMSAAHAGTWTIIGEVVNHYALYTLKYLLQHEDVKFDRFAHESYNLRVMLATSALKGSRWIGMSHAQRAMNHALLCELYALRARYLSDPRKEKIALHFKSTRGQKYRGEAQCLQQSVIHGTYAQAADGNVANTIIDHAALKARRIQPFIMKVKVGRRVLASPKTIWYGDPKFERLHRRFADSHWCVGEDEKMYYATAKKDLLILRKGLGIKRGSSDQEEPLGLWRLLKT